MHRTRLGLRRILLITLGYALLVHAHVPADGIDPAADAILQQHCLRCHGEEKTAARLDLRTLDGILRGGKRGPGLVPGRAAESRIVQLVRPGAKPHMPPGEKQLDLDQIALIENWISSLRPELASRRESASTPKATSQAATGTAVPAGVDPTLAIDLFLASRWQDRKIRVSERCDDATFARRLHLDLTGRIPTSQQLEKFQANPNSDKRQQLIDELLASDQYASHLADIFDAVLLGRRGERLIHERRQHGWRAYLESSFAENRPWNQMAREMVLARASEQTDVRAGWFLYERKNDYQGIAEAVSPSFFGLRIECAQCHDHPLASELEQRHYWGLVAFFNRGKNQNSKNGPRVGESAIGGFEKFTNLGGDAHDALLTYFASSTIKEARPENGTEEQDSDDNYLNETADIPAGEPRVPRFSRRQQFADEVLTEHPLLAKAFVNRMWALMMGRGIVHPVDRMDSAHPPSHPELLDWLADDFRRSGFDVKRLLRYIARSRGYQLDSLVADARALPEDFAFALGKPLTAESYVNSIYLALTERECSDLSLMNRFRRDFPDVFPEEPTATLTQALLLANNPDLNALFNSPEAKTIDELMQLSETNSRVESAFWKIFGRQPDAEELAAATKYLEQRDGTRAALSQLLWAMIASAEFRVNH